MSKEQKWIAKGLKLLLLSSILIVCMPEAKAQDSLYTNKDSIAVRIIRVDKANVYFLSVDDSSKTIRKIPRYQLTWIVKSTPFTAADTALYNSLSKEGGTSKLEEKPINTISSAAIPQINYGRKASNQFIVAGSLIVASSVLRLIAERKFDLGSPDPTTELKNRKRMADASSYLLAGAGVLVIAGSVNLSKAFKSTK